MHVRRDPFARGDYRRTTHVDGKPCGWCGQCKRRMYSYEWESDDRPNPLRGSCNPKVFCDFDCFVAYHA